MPLFSAKNGKLEPVAQTNFSVEKKLQTLIESNLDTVFKCRFVASEFPTGVQHAGRIDTLALSEDDNPVIIEYKKVESSDLINQSLYYLSWIHDHRGDFEIAAQKRLGGRASVDWSDVRVICIAPNYKKYDLHAVQMMGANIELWSYRLYSNDCLYLEEVFQRSIPSPSRTDATQVEKTTVGLTVGQKAAITRATGNYTFEQHLDGKPEAVRELAMAAHDFITGLDPGIETAPKKLYIAYKTSQNLVCMEVQHKRVILYLKVDPKEIKGPPGISRDVTKIGHFGTGDLEVTVKELADLEAVKPFVQKAYEQIGS